MGKRISDMDAASAFNTNDIVPIVDGNGTNKTVTGEKIKSMVSASPALTGNPTAPTQSEGNNSTRLATTAFVKTATDALLSDFTNPNQSSAVSVPSQTSPFTNITDFTLSAGTWLVIATVNFNKDNHDGAGYRAAIISQTSGASSANYTTTAIVGAAKTDVTRLQITCILTPSASTKYYIEAKQNSGDTLNVTARVQYIKLR